ncbi:hypothetical protein K505DRAFT_361321 [Melanomma pulvis-pyrius CBS 109.77]|uniref:Uncharacterized protein n=1 Tax=Melanomma pulvis-pyrius CBS 109.77 TaxID=1314802 RepID=A0A6A6XCE2_9PLEO|nr:hypothetical protein K505DRAFT_361321 [Melanomma pulvis-pyrius CBS 109.77]
MPHTFNYTAPPFIYSPSLLTFQPYPLFTPPQPLTTLILSQSLASNMSKMILLSRHISAIQIKRAKEMRPQSMEDLVELAALSETLETTRGEIEGELDGVWTRAGLLPPRSPGKDGIAPYKLVVENERMSKRKTSGEADGAAHSLSNKKLKNHVEEERDVTWAVGEPLQPLGIPTSAVPLTDREERRLSTWNWRDAVRGVDVDRGGVGEGCVSPMIGVFAGWDSSVGVQFGVLDA